MGSTTMHVTCTTCPVRGTHCDGCMVTALADPGVRGTGADLPLDADERAAVSALLRAGLVDLETAQAARAARDPLPLASRHRAVG